MSRRFWFAVAVGLSFATSLPSQQVRQQGDRSTAARAAIDRAWDLIAERAKSSDAAGMAALYAPDAMMIDTGIPTLTGRAAIEDALRQLLTTSRFVSMTHQRASLEIDGDIAIENGIIAPTWQEKGKEPVTTTERYTCVWKRINGNWLMLRDVGTPMAAASAAPDFTDARRAAIADTIRSLGDAAFAAVSNRDLDRLFELFDPAVSFINEGDFIKSWEQHQANSRMFFRTLKSIQMEPFDYRVEVLSPDVAVWSGRYRFTQVDSAGVTTTGTNAQSWVFQREASGWRIRHIHISAPPGR